MSQLKQKALNYIKAGALDNDDYERVQKIIIINLFSFVGMSITGVLAITAAFAGNQVLASVLFVASAVFALARLSLSRFGNDDLAASTILYILYLLMFYLIYSGGVEGTGPLWIFIVAPVSLFLKGLKKGLVNIAFFLLITCTLLFYPDNQFLGADYSTLFKTRLIYSFLTITFLSGCYELSRKQSYQYVKDLSREYEELSKYDPLTGVSNRRSATAKLENEQRKTFEGSVPLSIILCDVDHFKAVNDEFGHETGDQVLIQLAKLLSDSLRQEDLVARWGGEEFLLILPGTDREGAHAIAEKIHRRLAESALKVSDRVLSITISMGLAEVTGDEDIKTAIALADKYLYQAKKAGRNRTCSQEELV